MAKDNLNEHQRRGEYVTRTVTEIWEEDASADNPYLAEKCRCHGYDLIELMQKRSFVDVLFLLFKGELPAKEQAELLEHLMIAFINPGPRHPATRAAQLSGVSMTLVHHIVPVSLNVISGNHLGGGEVFRAMKFLKAHMEKFPENLSKSLFNKLSPPDDGDWHVAPGFGCRFGGIDPMPGKIAAMLADLPGSGEALAWGNSFAEAIRPRKMGWLTPGVVAAALIDLEFDRKAGPGFFQIISAPGLLAHGLELSGKPLTAMQFLGDERYIIDESAKCGKHKHIKKENSDER